MKATFRVQFDVVVDTDSEEFANLKEFKTEMQMNKDEFIQRIDRVLLTELFSQHAGFAISDDIEVVNVKYGNIFTDVHKVHAREHKGVSTGN